MVQSLAVAFSVRPASLGDELAAMEKAVPGAGERLLKMIEKEQHHQHEIASRKIGLSERGQWWGGGLTLLALGVGAWQLWVGHLWPGVILGGGGFTLVILAFIKTNFMQKRG